MQTTAASRSQLQRRPRRCAAAAARSCRLAAGVPCLCSCADTTPCSVRPPAPPPPPRPASLRRALPPAATLAAAPAPARHPPAAPHLAARLLTPPNSVGRRALLASAYPPPPNTHTQNPKQAAADGSKPHKVVIKSFKKPKLLTRPDLQQKVGRAPLPLHPFVGVRRLHPAVGLLRRAARLLHRSGVASAAPGLGPLSTPA